MSHSNTSWSWAWPSSVPACWQAQPNPNSSFSWGWDEFLSSLISGLSESFWVYYIKSMSRPRPVETGPKMWIPRLHRDSRSSLVLSPRLHNFTALCWPKKRRLLGFLIADSWSARNSGRFDILASKTKKSLQPPGIGPWTSGLSYQHYTKKLKRLGHYISITWQ